MTEHYDVIIIGSGPGGGSVATVLAPTGKKVLMLERGGYLPRSQQNWDSKTVFVDGTYQAKETWFSQTGESFHPGLHYWVGGNSKVYGAALFRLREKDFTEFATHDGISPGWPLGYDVFEPYYGKAEVLFQVRGQRGEDPLEPWTSTPYAHAPVKHEPRIQQLSEDWAKAGVHPFHLPLGIKLEQEADGRPTPHSPCIRCDAFDGFPCAINAKADAQIICVDPMKKAHDNFTLLTGAYVERLETDASGRSVKTVHVTREGRAETYSADIVVVACGALSSALLFLRSANDKHPNGLANGSDLVGRNYVRHKMSVLMALLKEPNDTVFQKTLAVSDFYFGSKDYDYPVGLIQMCATSHGEQIRSEAVPGVLDKFLPDTPFDVMARHSMDFWLQTEDIPLAENRITYQDGKVFLDVIETNTKPANDLKKELEKLCSSTGASTMMLERSLYLGKGIPLNGTAHQAGTLKFGEDPKTSVLDLDCKAHELDNVYVADASFFPSIGAVNPTLTIIANALRVGDIIKARLAASSPPLATAEFPLHDQDAR